MKESSKKGGKSDGGSRSSGPGKQSNRQNEPRGGKRSNRQNEPHSESANTGIRLNRYIANTGVCSRREADELIRSGQVQVNGKTITEMGIRVGAADLVSYRGKKLRGEKKVYVLLNKPKDTVTTVKDTHDRKTVMDLVSGCCEERIYPVGRLDRNTTGVLLLTNDGDLAETLSHPSFNKKKIYHIHIDKAITAPDMEKLSLGFELEDGFIRPDRVEYVETTDRKQIGMEIHSGQNRIVRRIFEHLGYKVTRLDRVYYAGLTKKGLSRGRWRHLSPKEVGLLKMSIPGKKSGSGKKPHSGKKSRSGKRPEKS